MLGIWLLLLPNQALMNALSFPYSVNLHVKHTIYGAISQQCKMDCWDNKK